MRGRWKRTWKSQNTQQLAGKAERKCARVWASGSACEHCGGGSTLHNDVRKTSSLRRKRRQIPRRVSSANGRRSASAAAFREVSSRRLVSNAHSRRALKVCRGRICERKMEKVRPHPPRFPRFEQKTRWPRKTLPAATAGSLPRRRLWRLSRPQRRQWGHRCCLSQRNPVSRS